MADYLQRLAFALPLVCLLAAMLLIGWRRLQQRGWRLPAGHAAGEGAPTPGSLPASAARWLTARRGPRPATRPAPAADLLLRDHRTLAPGARLCVVRFGGTDHLLGVTGAGIATLATSTPVPPDTSHQLDARRDVPQPHGLTTGGAYGAGLRPASAEKHAA